MSTTSKLTYLNNTKSLLKDRLNSLGAEITSSTTFRNYLTWLDTFYEDVSNMTDLSVNKIIGRTIQEQEPTPSTPQPVNNLTGNINYKITTQNGEETFTIPLGVIELCKIDNYEDKIYSLNGNFYIEKQIKRFVLKGTESWSTSSTSGSGISRYRCTSYENQLAKPETTSSKASIISQLFPTKTAGGTYSRNDGISLDVKPDILIYYSNINNSLSAFKSWLANNNVIMYGAIATPEIDEINEDNYPELYNTLKQIQDYLTAYKINKEFVLDYSSPEIEY